MKFIIIFTLFIFQIIGNEIISDYLPVTEAHITLQEIKKQSEKYKDLIIKNLTTDFDSCVDQLKLNECYLMDKWQSEIEKRKLENENSINIEVPFLKQRKAEKQQQLKQFIEQGTKYGGIMMSFVEQLKAEQQDFMTSSWEVQQLYKLPEDTMIELIQKHQQIDVVRALNANVPRVAENEVREAKKHYDIGEISIQAQTVAQEMVSAYKKLDDTLKSIDEAFTLTQNRIQKEKDHLTEDITRVRALLETEAQLQAKNLEKIAEIEQKIIICDTFPKSVYKDCGPLKTNQQKRLTTMKILETRTEMLFKEIEQLMKENQSIEQIEAQKQATLAMEEAEALGDLEESYVEGQEAMPVAEPPKELNPKHHLKEKVN